ncbi:MAG: tetratricopeptide repeat protein [Legionellaceae bacterium]|nr:tetratricopeptide repeat protein [Legionellaceae bacterium]
MSAHLDEQEQVERIHQWFKTYKKPLSIVFGLGVLTIGIYQYWSWHRTQVLTLASESYEHLMAAVSTQENDKAQAYAQSLLHQGKGLVYADIAGLWLAKNAVDQSDYSKALTYLQPVLQHGKEKVFRQVARLNMARIYLTQKQYVLAEKSLSVIEDTTYSPSILELQGDILRAENQDEQALQHYKKALQAFQEYHLNTSILEMKMHNILKVA